MKLWEYFLYAKKTKITTLFNNSSPLVQCSAILENIRWTQAAYAVLCQPHLTVTSSTFLHFDFNENSVSVWCGWHRTAYAVYTSLLYLFFLFYSICFLFIYYIIKKHCYVYCVKLTETCYITCILLLFCWFWLLPLSSFVKKVSAI